ncbi:MAG: hypothetical protein DRH34_09355 [Deltaproteobacteria bacterium]|nr:MAG: hypothetical protein DRH34_09355 [Deltaproteobacteria bacterium]
MYQKALRSIKSNNLIRKLFFKYFFKTLYIVIYTFSSLRQIFNYMEMGIIKLIKLILIFIGKKNII